MEIQNWSIKSILNIIPDNNKWDKKTLYATDSFKCPGGIYHQMKGAEPTNPDDPRGLRRMEVGNMVELNQVEKLKSLGLVIDAQSRIFDPVYNVSGRPDILIISPDQCTSEAKELINRKKEIYQAIKSYKKIIESLEKDYELNIEDKNLDLYVSKIADLFKEIRKLNDEDYEINQKLLIPDPNNSLMLVEVKSIVEKGFDWRAKDGKPMDEHKNQIMFYLWKLKEKYPWIIGRIIYVDTSYQNILEFDVQFEEDSIENSKKFWHYINECLEENKQPEPAPAVVQNPKTGKWQVNFQADWCKYHILCTGDPMWKTKAIQKVEELNELIPTKKYARKRNSSN